MKNIVIGLLVLVCGWLAIEKDRTEKKLSFETARRVAAEESGNQWLRERNEWRDIAVAADNESRAAQPSLRVTDICTDAGRCATAYSYE